MLSASFIPVFSRSLEHDSEESNVELAAAVGTLLTVAATITSGLFFLFAEPLTHIFAGGLSGERFALTVQLTRIVTLGMVFSVASAWCLGVLNSHRKFFLAYAAPVVWNITQIIAAFMAALFALKATKATNVIAIALVLGSCGAFLVQLPTVIRLLPHLRPSFRWRSPDVQKVVSRFLPAVAGRGVVQLSIFIDLQLASFLAANAIGIDYLSQLFYQLPVGIFAMAIANAELPELSRLLTKPTQFRQRTARGLRQIAFLCLPCSVFFFFGGDIIARLVSFDGPAVTDFHRTFWFSLGLYGAALICTAQSRMLQSALFAAGDVKGPARISVIRLLGSAGTSIGVMFSLDRLMLVDGHIVGMNKLVGFPSPLPSHLREAVTSVPRLGVLGLAFGSVVGSVLEYIFLKKRLHKTLGWSPKLTQFYWRLAPGLLAMGIAILLLKNLVWQYNIVLVAIVVIGGAGAAYIGVCLLCSIQETDLIVGKLRQRLRAG